MYEATGRDKLVEDVGADAARQVDHLLAGTHGPYRVARQGEATFVRRGTGEVRVTSERIARVPLNSAGREETPMDPAQKLFTERVREVGPRL